MHEISDDLKCKIAQSIAWISVVLGGVSLEIWIALAGAAISAIPVMDQLPVANVPGQAASRTGAA